MMIKIKSILLLLIIYFLNAVQATAQSHSNSPYSDQAYDPVDNPQWYETPFLWIGLIIILGLIFYLLYRKAERDRRRL